MTGCDEDGHRVNKKDQSIWRAGRHLLVLGGNGKNWRAAGVSRLVSKSYQPAHAGRSPEPPPFCPLARGVGAFRLPTTNTLISVLVGTSSTSSRNTSARFCRPLLVPLKRAKK